MHKRKELIKLKYTFTCKYLSRTSGKEDYNLFIPEGSSKCLYCDYWNSTLCGRCNLCIHLSKCDNSVICFSDDSYSK